MKTEINSANVPGQSEFDYGDGDIPEIDTTKFQSNASDTIPEEFPQQDRHGKIKAI